MLTVSAPAKELLRTIEIPDNRALRLEPVEGGQLGFVAGAPDPDDQVIKESGEEVLRVAGAVSDQLDGHSLERVETPEGPRLTINRPEAANSAG
jgi:iron-sulfur cluster assembly protein